nr:hypothetical protein [Tanacetum cinerariifolium]
MYHPHRASPSQHQSSLISTFNLDDDYFDPLWGSASQPTQYTEGPSEPVEDDSPVEEVTAVKPKRKYMRRRQPIKKDDKEFVEQWTPEEEVALCKAWVLDGSNRDHSKWRKVEMPKFFKTKKTSFKKSRTSETTSQGNSDSAYIGVDLNDEATNSEDVEVQEVRPMYRDRAKKKGSSSGARSESCCR